MTEKSKYRLWLKFRVGKLLATEERALTATVASRTVTIESERKSQPLSEASWVVMGCRGFEAENHAREFGEELRRAAHLAGLCARVGVDAGDPGEDPTVSWFNPEILCGIEGLDPNTRIGPDVHGIVVLPDDGKTLFVRGGHASGQVRIYAAEFVRALEEALPESDTAGSDFPSIRRAIRVLNLAEMNEDETKQVINAILQVRRESIRQRIRKILVANELSDMWSDWETLYNARSRLFHGRTEAGKEYRGDYLKESELHSLGQESINLCTRIVLSMAKREGISVPDGAKVHFGVE